MVGYFIFHFAMDPTKVPTRQLSMTPAAIAARQRRAAETAEQRQQRLQTNRECRKRKMLLRNLNTRRGLCNGTRLKVKELKPHVILAEVLTGSAEGQLVFIPRIDLAPSRVDLPFILRRRQFPVKLAFAMTINKSQGQTLEKVGIYLSEPVFGHGQLYVAFSRVCKSCDVKVQILPGPYQGKLIEELQKIFTKNIVYKDVLTN